MTIFYNPHCLEYSTPGHPERPDRIARTAPLIKERHPEWQWREPVTSFLIRAVTAIFRVHLNLCVRQCARNCHGLIVTSVVHHDHEIHNAMCHDFIVSLAQCARGVIRGHYYHNFLAV